MASDQGDEKRLAAFAAALGGNENSDPTTNGHATNNTWAASADKAWKEPPSLSAEPEDDYPESLRLQKQFLDTHGYK